MFVFINRENGADFSFWNVYGLFPAWNADTSQSNVPEACYDRSAKGTLVFTMSVSDVAQLGQYRFALESMALDLSMNPRKEPLVSRLFEICDAMAAARNNDDVSNYLKLDDQFHRTIFNFCDNKYLAEGYKAIAGKVAALRTHLSQHPTHTEKSMGEHVEIAELLRDGKIKKAKQVVKRYVTRGERTYADGIEDWTPAMLARLKSCKKSRCDSVGTAFRV